MSYERGPQGIQGPAGPTGATGGGNASEWSTFPATQQVDFVNNTIFGPSSIDGLNGTMSTLTIQQANENTFLTLNGEAIGVTPGLYNRLQIVPTVFGQTSSTVYYTGPTGLTGPPNSWIGSTGTAQPLTGGTLDGWRNFKQVGVTGPATQVQFSMYNPYFGQGVTYTVDPTPTILKKDLSTVWAVITTKNRINVQGTIFFNIYTYDITNPPTAPADYTNRFDYSIAIYPTMYGSPTTFQQSLAGGFRYLICAVDSPKTSQQTLANRTVTLALNQLVTGNTYTIFTVGTGVNWTSIGAAVATVGCVFVYNGTATTGTLGVAQEEVTTALLIGNLQTPEQTTFLRDPYDIYIDIPHVPFNAVTGASNAPQPADISNIAVSKIVIGSTSSALGCPTLDWTVEACGYSSVIAGVNEEFILKYS